VVVNGVDAGRPLPDDETTTALLAGANDLDDAERVALADAARFRRCRREMQREEIDRLAQLLPLPQLCVPQVIAAGVRSEHMALLAAELLISIRGLPA
jgi:hypothetical protein